jgi:hypothetical protein
MLQSTTHTPGFFHTAFAVSWEGITQPTCVSNHIPDGLQSQMCTCPSPAQLATRKEGLAPAPCGCSLAGRGKAHRSVTTVECPCMQRVHQGVVDIMSGQPSSAASTCGPQWSSPEVLGLSQWDIHCNEIESRMPADQLAPAYLQNCQGFPQGLPCSNGSSGLCADSPDSECPICGACQEELGSWDSCNGWVYPTHTCHHASVANQGSPHFSCLQGTVRTNGGSECGG